jgi:hypothetical protein
MLTYNTEFDVKLSLDEIMDSMSQLLKADQKSYNEWFRRLANFNDDLKVELKNAIKWSQMPP